MLLIDVELCITPSYSYCALAYLSLHRAITHILATVLPTVSVMDLVTGSKAMLLIDYMHLFVVRVVPFFWYIVHIHLMCYITNSRTTTLAPQA